MDLHERLKRARESAGFSNASEFARLIDVQPNSVYRYERGEQTPSLVVAGRWAEQTGVSLDWLVRGEGDPPPEEALDAVGS